MSLDSAFFLLCFLPLAAILYYLLRGERSGNILLLILSLLFCAFGSLSSLCLLLAAALVNYVFGLLILRFPKAGKALAALAVVLDLAFLGAFKYLAFLLSLVLPLPAAGWSGLGVAAPLGISFFTFKCISYIVDTRRDPACGTRSFFRLLLYISFFPQLTAGPITRFPEFNAQLGARTRRADDLGQGLRRFVLGLGKKLILAAGAARIADPVFAQGAPLIAPLAWLGAMAYLMQIYFDFSGYSDMAIGLGRIFGFRTPENFRDPYTADSITDFWRRWHMTLSYWFRDYVYIPLGGNRKGLLRQLVNIIIVWFLTGLWHGAAWNFILWGMFYGFLLILEKLFLLKYLQKAPRFLQHSYTMAAVLIAWVFFAFTDIGQGMHYLSRMFASPALYSGLTLYYLRDNLAVLLIGILASTTLLQKADRFLQERLPWSTPLLCAGCLLLCTAFIVDASYNPFLYFRFRYERKHAEKTESAAVRYHHPCTVRGFHRASAPDLLRKRKPGARCRTGHIHAQCVLRRLRYRL